MADAHGSGKGDVQPSRVLRRIPVYYTGAVVEGQQLCALQVSKARSNRFITVVVISCFHMPLIPAV